MSDSSKRAKAASVASFLFLPQFDRMLKSSSTLIPVFMRTIANLFIQAGLLPLTHPAALYGDPSVEKCRFSKMIGDAWYTLRSGSATSYQWSVFSSVILMLFMLLCSVVTVAMNLSSIFVSSAAAQIFSPPLGAGQPTTLQTAVLTAPCTANTPFCRVIPPAATGHGDYAIDILDKMLRLGANNNGGAPMQNALGALMLIYNSAVLVIAGVMIFWLIISVVVDIAKTGQIGGGRHNLVWAPIRIVFALAVLMPLGTTGYSAGQFAVMKLAEWGSNLGSNGWNAYLTIVLGKAVVVVPELPSGEDYLPLVEAYARMWTCRVAHNGYGFQSEGANFDPKQQVVFVPDLNEIDQGQQSYTFTNATTGALCGRVTFPTQNDPQLTAIAALASPPADILAVKTAKYKQLMNKAWQDLFVTSLTSVPTVNSATGVTVYRTTAMSAAGLPLGQAARSFACGFVAQHLWGQVPSSGGSDVLSLDCAGLPQNPCGSGGPGSGQYPDMSCVDGATENDTRTMAGIIDATIDGAPGGAKGAAQNARDIFLGLAPADLFGTRGWADMGAFYKSIATMTMTVRALSTSSMGMP